MLLLDNGRIRIEYERPSATLHVYRDGLYAGSESLAECVRHITYESPLEEYRKAELDSRPVH